MNRNKQYADAVVEGLTQLAIIFETMRNLPKAFYDRSHDKKGNLKEIQEAQLIQTHGLTLSEFSSARIFIEQLTNMMENKPVVTGDYQSTLNKIRTRFK